MHSFLLPSVTGVTSLVGYDDGPPEMSPSCLLCSVYYTVYDLKYHCWQVIIFVYDDPLIFQPGVQCVAYTTSAVRCYAVTS